MCHHPLLSVISVGVPRFIFLRVASCTNGMPQCTAHMLPRFGGHARCEVQRLSLYIVNADVQGRDKGNSEATKLGRFPDKATGDRVLARQALALA
jgi:hypothetical protein